MAPAAGALAMIGVVQTHDPEILRIDNDCLVSRIIGFFVICIGAGVVVLFSGVVEGENESPGSVWDLVFIVTAGSLVALFGLTMLLWEGQTIVDRRLGKVVQWHRVLVWQLRHTYDLSSFSRVGLARVRSRYAVSYVPELQTNDGSVTVWCGPSATKSEAVELAKHIATFAGLDLVEQ